MSDFLKMNRNGQILEIVSLKGIKKIESTEKGRAEIVAWLRGGKDPST
jgi:hypothetical protein